MVLRLIILCLFISVLPNAFADPGDQVLALMNEDIDNLQYALDSHDGLADGQISIANNANSSRANDLYIVKINALQKQINDQEQHWTTQRDLLRNLRSWLKAVDINQMTNSKVLDQFEVKYSLFTNTRLDWVQRRLLSDPDLAIELYPVYKNAAFSPQIIHSIYNRNPDFFFENIGEFQDSDQAVTIIDQMIKDNPIKMKRWLGSRTYMNQVIHSSSAPSTQLFIQLFNQFGRPSKSFYLMNDILNGKISPNEAEAIGQNVQKFRNYLIDLSKQRGIIAEEAVNDRLQEEALRVVRPINDLHENHDYSVRFKSANNLSSEELYAYTVYTQEEIFTSTFNGFYERMMSRMKEDNTYDFLEHQNFNKYRTYIKMLAGYNKLSDFLSHMSEEQQKQLLNQFVSNLEEGDIQQSLTDAVDVADTFGSINDKTLQAFFTDKLGSELSRVQALNNQHGIRIYSLLNVILSESVAHSDAWIDDLVAKYNIPKINELDFDGLKNKNGKVIAHVFFFDDDDGKASYNSWLPAYRNGNWTISDHKTYIKITSKGGKIQIYANKPEYEFDGKDDILALFAKEQIEPSVVIHRGHSFYVDTTIETLTPSAHLVFLGSCGGYHKLTSVLDRSPEVQIISSKQVGTMAINDPLIRLLNKNLLEENDIHWQKFWNTLDGQIKATGSANYERFKDYIPPHRNLGAIFIMAYNRLKEQPN